MIRPFTCLTLVAACGAGLYLYQVKHRAQLVDRDITRTVKLTEQSRDRISLLKTELANLTTPSRLTSLAAEHLQLQPTQPAQYVRLEDLRSRLPPISPPSATPAPVEEAPVAAATPPVPVAKPAAPLPMLAMIQAAPAPVMPAPSVPKQVTPVASRPVQIAAPLVNVAATVKVPLPVASVAVARVVPKPVPPHVLMAGLTKPREPEPMPPREPAVKEPAARESVAHESAAHEPAAHQAATHEPATHEPATHEPVAREPAVREAAAPAPPHRLFAPVMPAYAPTPVVVHAPTVQTASATSQSSPFIGSALGMAHTVLAAPVPVQAGYPSGQ